jgi:hypothetical protein
VVAAVSWLLGYCYYYYYCFDDVALSGFGAGCGFLRFVSGFMIVYFGFFLSTRFLKLALVSNQIINIYKILKVR